MSEKYAANVYCADSSSTVDLLTNKHVLELRMKFFYGEERYTAGAWIDPPPTTTTGSTTSTTGTTTSSTAGTTSGTTGSTGTSETPTEDPEGEGGEWYEIYINAEAGNGILPYSLAGYVQTPHLRDADATHSLPQMIGGTINQRGDEMPLAIYSSAALEGKDITVLVIHVTTGSGGGSGYTSTIKGYRKYVYRIGKHMCEDASVDSRKGYGQPNTEGQFPGDPNAEPRSVNFNNWVWKGGLFLGQVPWQTRDESGAAIAQISPGISSTDDFRLATLSIYQFGPHPDHTGDVTLGAFAPSPDDPNLAVAPEASRWENRWSVGTNTVVGSAFNSGYDHGTPFATVALTGTDAGFKNVGLSRTGYDTDFTRPVARQAIALAMVDPAYGTSTDRWRYFASKEHAATIADAREADIAPRVWTLSLIGSDSWTETFTSATTGGSR